MLEDLKSRNDTKGVRWKSISAEDIGDYRGTEASAGVDRAAYQRFDAKWFPPAFLSRIEKETPPAAEIEQLARGSGIPLNAVQCSSGIDLECRPLALFRGE